MGILSRLIKGSDPEGNFLQQIASQKTRTDAAVSAAAIQHDQELEKRFSEDVKLKEQLSQFARANALDQALIALWREIEPYPEWSREEDFDKWKKLPFTDIAGSSEEDTKSVEFTYGGQRFKVTARSWTGMGSSGDLLDLSFFEDGEEVFAVGFAVDYDEFGRSDRCRTISAFKKRGNWAKQLLQHYGRIQIDRDKDSSRLKYFGADEIKSRFEA